MVHREVNWSVLYLLLQYVSVFVIVYADRVLVLTFQCGKRFYNYKVHALCLMLIPIIAQYFNFIDVK